MGDGCRRGAQSSIDPARRNAQRGTPENARRRIITIRTHVPLKTKLAYGLGGFAFGVKENGFSVFLAFFYNQVIGLPAGPVGIAIALALLVDAFVDPFVGHLSDRTNSKWGRRLPWLYVSAIPIALGWLALWNPPDWGEGPLLVYLFFSCVAVRAAVSCNEVPGLALAPEITNDYHERTMVLRYRFLFAFMGGMVMYLLTFAFLLTPDPPAYPTGQLNPDGYPRFAIVGALMMAVPILLSAYALHAKYGKRHELPVGVTEDHSLKAILQTIKIRPFLILLTAALFAFAGQGLAFAMGNYVLLHVWGFNQADFIYYGLALLAGMVGAFLILPFVSRRMEKSNAAAMFALIGLTAGAMPYALRFIGVFPPNGTLAMMVLFLTLTATSLGSGSAVVMLTSSMMADVTDWSEEQTGQRREGLFFAGYFFTQKCVTALGIFLTTSILTAIQFPVSAQQGQVPAEIVDRLAIIFPCVIVILGSLAALSYRHFPITYKQHQEIMRRLAVREGIFD